jgi:molybdenum cofactor cytidylyltransferase
MKLGVVILAAGASSRMGRPKLLLPWENTTVIGHLLRQWQHLDATQIAVVCATANTALASELDRLVFPPANRIINPQPERGMFSSIQCAAQWNGWQPQVTHWAITLGDQPHVRMETLRRLIDFAAAQPASVCQPAHRGHGRHPVILPTEVFLRLKDSQAANLKEFLSASGLSVARCEADDPGLDLDLDEPADYDRALAFVNLK